MSKKYFTENISDETLAKLIDKTLNFEKNNVSEKKIKINLINIIPVAALFAIVIGVLNILPRFMNPGTDVEPPDNFSAATDESLYVTADEEIPLFLPTVIEKSFFEKRILDAITDKRDFDTLISYYMNNDDMFYVLDPNISEREKNILLESIRKYTDLTGSDIYQMCINYGISVPKSAEPAYSHVRFGATDDTLLLDIEWHTYETYMEENIEEYIDVIIPKIKNSDDYLNASDKLKKGFDNIMESELKSREEWAIRIKNKNMYLARTINGRKSYEMGIAITINGNGNEPDSNCFTPEGYYIFEVYPHNIVISYFDENEEHQYKIFEVYSKREFDWEMENSVIPFCNELLSKGLITQEYYNEAIKITDPLDKYVDMFFN